jgi:hypothetical protein
MATINRISHYQPKSKFMKKTTLFIATAAIALCCNLQALADHLTSKYLFAARMNGAQEVPAVATNAVGLATFNLNAHRDSICIEGTFNGLSGPITGIHIHEAMPGMSGGVVLDLMPYMSGNHLKGTVAGSALTPQFIQKMFSGMFYLNVHTSANPNGEIRGQIMAEEDLGMHVRLDGNQEVPAVATNATGLGFFWLAKHNGKLSFRVVVDGLSGPITGAHLHKNVMGQNGPVAEDLMMYINGNTIVGSVDPTAYLTALMMDSLYINIHTTANPNGEIRGQLMKKPYLHYDAWMTGGQEVPAVTTNAMGLTVARVNYTFDTIWYDMQATGLSGAIQAAHFHKAALGQNGGVIAPIANVSGNMAMGMFTGSQVTDSFLNFMNEGNIYVNVHTAANPNGEIRGQVYRTFREGYTFHINGMQEVPATASMAYGTGMVSIDRDQTNAHYMMVTRGISPSGVHFHNAVAGQNGPVIYDLTGMYNNGGIFGYWRENDMTAPFTTPISNKFRKDSVYVNYHTSANPNGEIRGNTNRMLCNAFTTSVTTIGGVQAEVSIYPNPAQQSARLQVVVKEKTEATVEMVDVMGRKIWSRNATLSSGTNHIALPLESVAPGIYLINIISTNGKHTERLIKD